MRRYIKIGLSPTNTLTLEPNDEILLYTDGVSEAFSTTEEEYGNDRLEEFVTTHADLRPEELVRDCAQAWPPGPRAPSSPTT